MIAILTFLKTVVSLASFLGAGAAAALIGQVVGRYLSPLVGIVCGAIVVGAMAFWVWTSDDTALKAENEALRAKRDELVLTTQALRKTLQSLREASESNAKVMEDLRDQVAAMEDRPECNIDGSIVDELNRIR